MAGLIRRDLTSAFKLLRDRSDHTGGDFYNLEQDEKEQLIEDNDDVVHFSASTGKMVQKILKVYETKFPFRSKTCVESSVTFGIRKAFF